MSKEMNELFIGVGFVGIAAYLLWPKAVPAISVSEPGPIAQLGGFALPNIPAYLSANRPGFAISPTPYEAAGGFLPLENHGASSGNSTTPPEPYEPALQSNLNFWPGNGLLDLAPPGSGALGGFLHTAIAPGVVMWPTTAARGDDPSLPQPAPQIAASTSECDCC